ncbi:MAG: hypothetical protein G01um101420_80 [Parcubacteria group bacterium Gr01-1014_20]|nr:MAG: hypothetical protein G01um101420_80 [Parcubacteria group bacterium Gr01-1014_20]
MIDWAGNLLSQGMALLVFAALAILGAVVSIVSMIFGGDHDTDHDVDHGGDGHHGDHGDHDSGMGLSGWLLYPVMSVRGMSLLATGFGALGFITYYMTQKLLFSCGVGAFSGWIFAFIGFMLIRMFKKQQSNSLLSNESLIDREAIVTLSIPVDGMGEVTLVVPGQGQIRRTATASKQVSSGRPVRIVRTFGSNVEVEEL